MTIGNLYMQNINKYLYLIISGEYESGRRQGHGSYIYTSGDVYEGLVLKYIINTIYMNHNIHVYLNTYSILYTYVMVTVELIKMAKSAAKESIYTPMAIATMAIGRMACMTVTESSQLPTATVTLESTRKTKCMVVACISTPPVMYTREISNMIKSTERESKLI